MTKWGMYAVWNDYVRCWISIENNIVDEMLIWFGYVLRMVENALIRWQYKITIWESEKSR